MSVWVRVRVRVRGRGKGRVREHTPNTNPLTHSLTHSPAGVGTSSNRWRRMTHSRVLVVQLNLKSEGEVVGFFRTCVQANSVGFVEHECRRIFVRSPNATL